MPSALSLPRASELFLPVRPVLIDRNKAGLNVPAWPFLGISLVTLLAIAVAVKKWLVFLIPPCGLHSMTGIPCPTCGFTRMVFFLLELDFKSAFLIQPLMFLATAFFAAWIVSGLVSYLFGKLMFIEVSPFWRRFIWIPLAAAFMLNWLYLLKTGV